jgi:hypothetical protein
MGQGGGAIGESDGDGGSTLRPCDGPVDRDDDLGAGVIFAVHHRPVPGKRGPYRVNLRHGVSRIRSGLRYSLGIIFRDAA